MCLPCGPRRNSRTSYYKPHPLPTFNSLEDYLAFLEKNPVGSYGFRPLPVALQSTENFVKIVSQHPEVISRVPKKYQNRKVMEAAGLG